MTSEEYDVRFMHFRAPEWDSFNQRGAPDPKDLEYYSRQFGWGAEVLFQPFLEGVAPCPRGGATLCFLDAGDTGAVGVALCSWGDNFCYERGRKIAYDRAVLALQGVDTGPRNGGEEYIGGEYVAKLRSKRDRYLETTRGEGNDEEE